LTSLPLTSTLAARRLTHILLHHTDAPQRHLRFSTFQHYAGPPGPDTLTRTQPLEDQDFGPGPASLRRHFALHLLDTYHIDSVELESLTIH